MTPDYSVVDQDRQEAADAARFDLSTRHERRYGEDAPTLAELRAEVDR